MTQGGPMQLGPRLKSLGLKSLGLKSLGLKSLRWKTLGRKIQRGALERLRQKLIPGRRPEQSGVVGAEQLRHGPPDLALAKNPGRDFRIRALGDRTQAAFLGNQFGQGGP